MINSDIKYISNNLGNGFFRLFDQNLIEYDSNPVLNMWDEQRDLKLKSNTIVVVDKVCTQNETKILEIR